MEQWITSLLALIGTCVGSLSGVLASNRLVNWRIASLEEKVDRHNHIIERTYRVEERSKSNTHRIDELEGRLHACEKL